MNPSEAAPTVTLVVALTDPLAETAVNWKLSTVPAVAPGTTKVAVAVVAPASVTVRPAVCVQLTLSTWPIAAPVSVATRPADELPPAVAVTVTGLLPLPSLSSSHPVSSIPPNTAAAVADMPPINVWRRE